jgi:hypothetical protein
MEHSLTAERVRELLDYNPRTGIFTWAISRRRCRKGSVAGCVMRNGYVVIRVDDRLYLAHRLAWLHVHGRWPVEQLDHIDRNRANNTLRNLREVTNAENAQNQKPRKNKSGFSGVRKENNKWLAEIKVNYKPIRIGLFETPEAAHAAYIDAKRKLHQKFPANIE